MKDKKCNFIWEPEVGNQIPEGAIKVGYNNNKEDLYIAKTSTSPRSFLIAQSAESKFIFRLSIYVVKYIFIMNGNGFFYTDVKLRRAANLLG